jgi:hypothetical protein
MNAFNGHSVSPRPSLASYRNIARAYEGCNKDTRARCVRR